MRRFSGRIQLKHSASITALVAAGFLPGLACGGDDGGGGKSDQTDDTPEVQTGTMNVSVTFPNQAAETTTGSIHVWVIVPTEETTCAALVGGKVDPYDLEHKRLADVVTTETTAPVEAEAEVGNAIIYVEGVDYSGNTEWAGCTEVDITTNGGSVTIDLGRYRIFDCGKPETEDGSPCDDGENCTVGETCEAGRCQGGGQRNCDHIADACHAGTCDELEGCIATPLPDNTPCDDGFVCIVNEVCIMGACVGVQRDCGAEAGQCEVATGSCDEISGDCLFSYAPYGTDCEDGLFCTDSDYCDYYGTCQGGGALDCTNSGCAAGYCDETTDECVTTPALQGTSCSDPCLLSGATCDGSGNCVGTARDCSSYDGPCRVGVCDRDYGGCTYEPVAAGTACAYDDPQCSTAGICDSSGYCSSTYTNQSGACNDGNPCTINEYCYYGACMYGTTAYPDLDTDGYYDEVCGYTDCDDSNSAIHPGATEICDDLIDNDCDGLVDTADTIPCPPTP